MGRGVAQRERRAGTRRRNPLYAKVGPPASGRYPVARGPSAPRPLVRCRWATRDPLLSYLDVEWGTPLHDDRLLFEFLILEGMQAGLSWETVLRKRDAFRRAFLRFDPVKVARFGTRDVARLMRDETIIRNRAKIEAAIGNAQALLVLRNEFGTFDAYVWKFTDKDALSKDLKKRGFRFIGPTIVESFMQAVGIRNDHERGCYRRAELTRARTFKPAR